jgi:hypothetical protein
MCKNHQIKSNQIINLFVNGILGFTETRTSSQRNVEKLEDKLLDHKRRPLIFDYYC